VTYSSLISLEVNLPIKDAQHKRGWLTDSIIDSFLLCLQKQHKDVIVCGAIESLAIASTNSARLLWRGFELKKIKKIFIPFNPSHVHWILIVLMVETSSIVVLDPMKKSFHKEDYQKAVTVGEKLLQKFGKVSYSTATLDHALQEDSSSCGVYCCYYAEQLAKGVNIFILNEMRLHLRLLDLLSAV